MSDDKISRQALLDEINEEIEYGEEHFRPENEQINKGLKIARKLVRALPTIEAEPVNGWISVKDRLPEKDGRYVVWSDGELNICEYDVESQTFGDTFYDYDEMYSKLLCWDDDINKFVTHWQPLPKPPKGE